MRSLLPLVRLALAAAAPALATESARSGVPLGPAARRRRSRRCAPARCSGSRSSRAARGSRASGSSATASCKIDVCDGNCPRNYRLRIDIQSPQRARSSRSPAAALIRAAGGFAPQRQLSAAISGGGKIDVARGLRPSDVNAAVHGGGLISVRARSSAVGGGQWRRRSALLGQSRASPARSTAAAPSTAIGLELGRPRPGRRRTSRPTVSSARKAL